MTVGTVSQGIKLTVAHREALDIALDLALNGGGNRTKTVAIKWLYAHFAEYLQTGDERSFLNGLPELRQAVVDEIGEGAALTEEAVRHPNPREAQSDLLAWRRELKAFKELLAAIETRFGLRPRVSNTSPA